MPVAKGKAIPAHIAPLPVELRPSKSSTQLIIEHVERLKAAGTPQKSIGLTLGFGPNFVSMLKKGEDLPLPRVIAFARAAGLSDAERHELLHTRILELHGGKGEFDLEALVAWGAELFGVSGDEGAVVELWREVCAPAPYLVAGLLESPEAKARIRRVLNELVQEVFREAAAAD